MQKRTLYILIFFLCSTLMLSAEESTTLISPPSSLKQWYKPANKRNVFHHNMFKLRRELQAIKLYRSKKDLKHTQKWAKQFADHYLKIAEMVPEWKKELRLKRTKQLKTAIKEGDLNAIGNAIKKIQKSCANCHESYRAQVAALYRSPDFSQIHVRLNTKETRYKDFMIRLMRDINRIKISADDDNIAEAKMALKEVRAGIETLRSSCDHCHKGSKAKDYYLGAEASELLDKLESAIDKGKSGRPLGEFAVHACARCHGSHRIIYDLTSEYKESIQ